MATECECKVYGNQHGRFFRPCDDHGRLMKTVAALEGKTPEEFLNDALTTYLEKVF